MDKEGYKIIISLPEYEVNLYFNDRKAAYKVIADMEKKLANRASIVDMYTDDRQNILVIPIEKLRQSTIFMTKCKLNEI